MKNANTKFLENSIWFWKIQNVCKNFRKILRTYHAVHFWEHHIFQKVADSKICFLKPENFKIFRKTWYTFWKRRNLRNVEYFEKRAVCLEKCINILINTKIFFSFFLFYINSCYYFIFLKEVLDMKTKYLSLFFHLTIIFGKYA